MSDIEEPNSVAILKALQARGFGAPRAPVGPAVDRFQGLQQASLWTGAIYPEQTQTAKHVAIALYGPTAVCLADTESATFKVLTLRDPEFPHDDARRQGLVSAVKAIFGTSWSVTLGIYEPSKPVRPRRQGKKPARAKRGRGRRKARR